MAKQHPALLLICYNRPDLLEQVLKSLPSRYEGRIYISCDGPKADDEQDYILVKKNEQLVREHFRNHPLLNLRVHSENLGCRQHVQGAISWFFQNEEEGIVLEDDCVVADDFIAFCAEMLERWRHNPKIMLITGDNSFNVQAPGGYSYGFADRPLIWGWATWRRAWLQNDPDLKSWGEIRGTTYEKGMWPSKKEARFRRQLLDRIVSSGVPDTWDAQWAYSIKLMGGLTIMPAKNLVRNIGFRADATHTKTLEHPRAECPTGAVFPLAHPTSVANTMKVPK